MTARPDTARLEAAPERAEPLADSERTPQVSRQDVLTMIDERLASHAAAHAAEMAARDVTIEQLKSIVQTLSAAGVSPNKPEFVALKRATFTASDYERVRTWCEKGLIVARKDGRRWFVDATSLKEYRAIRGR
jgi:hypothetical protein